LLDEPSRVRFRRCQFESAFRRLDGHHGLQGPGRQLLLSEEVELVDALEGEEVGQGNRGDAHVPGCLEDHVVEVGEAISVGRRLTKKRHSCAPALALEPSRFIILLVIEPGGRTNSRARSWTVAGARCIDEPPYLWASTT